MTDCAEGGGSRRRAGRPQRPLDPASGPAAAFACALRELRAEAGNPSYRELARRALFVPSVLSTAASGSAFPSLRVTLAFVRACGGDAEEWRRRWEAVAAHADPASSGSLTFPQRLAADGPRPQLLPGGATLRAPQYPPQFLPEGAQPGPGLPSPAQLPSVSPDYTGREAECARLLVLTNTGSLSRAASVAISGPVGVGKTAFALAFAHRAAPDYPDGQLHADLARCRAHGQTPHDLIGRFLGALGVESGQVPAEPQQRAGLYRSVLATRRVLIVLDDAETEAEVRPLLATGACSLVVVTSRRRLAGLDNVRRITLDALSAEESLALLAAVVGEHRIVAASTVSEAGSAALLGELCGHLPLALWIAATRVAGHGGWNASHAVQRLQSASGSLDWLRAGDISVRDRLRSAYRALDPVTRRAFRCLGRVTGSDVDAAQLAGLLAISAFEAESLLDALVDGGLLQVSRTTAGYHMPVLFAAFARELPHKREPVLAREQPDEKEPVIVTRLRRLSSGLPVAQSRLAHC